MTQRSRLTPPPARPKLDTPEADAFIAGRPVSPSAPAPHPAQANEADWGASAAIPRELQKVGGLPWEGVLPGATKGLLVRMPESEYHMLRWLARSVYNTTLQELSMAVLRNFLEPALKAQGFEVTRDQAEMLQARKPT